MCAPVVFAVRCRLMQIVHMGKAMVKAVKAAPPPPQVGYYATIRTALLLTCKHQPSKVNMHIVWSCVYGLVWEACCVQD
jgi:hypothetical protein